MCACLVASAPAPAADARGRSVRVTVWTIADGLPQGTVNAIRQTSDGALWLATFGGLLRFDGIEFRAFDLDTQAGVPTNRLTGLFVDEHDGLSLLTQSGDLVRVKDGVVTGVHRPADVPGFEAVVMVTNTRGTAWVRSTGGAVRRFDHDGWKALFRLGDESSYQGMSLSPSGTMHAASQSDLVRFDDSGALATLTAPARILAVEDTNGDGPWLGLVDGLARAHDGRIERIVTEPALDEPIRCILEDGEGGLWLGTREGVAHLVSRDGGARWIVDVVPVLPAGFQVRSMLRDREGNVWLGSPASGLARLSPRRVEHPGGTDMPGSNNITEPVGALVGDGAGGAWIGSEHQGLTHLHVDGSLEHVELPLLAGESPAVAALLRDGRGRLWVALGDRVLRSAGTTFVSVDLGLAPATRIGSLVEDRAGRVWIATVGTQLLELGPDDRVRAVHDVPAQIVSLSPAPDGSLWIGSKGEILRLFDGHYERFGPAAGMPGGDVRDVLGEADGSAWVATYGGGLGRFRAGRVTTIARAHGLPDASLSRILDDGDGREGQGSLWMLSNRGLIVARKDDLAAIVENRARRFDPVVLGPESGTPEGKFGAPAGFRDEAGRLWFGTVDGVVRVAPQDFPFNRTTPKLRIERIQVEDRPIPFSSVVEIPPGARRVVVEFTAFALTAPERVHFRYRLQGLDDDWIDLGNQRSAVFTALKPGSYLFRAEARNEDGVWSDEPTGLRMNVLPSWWETILFRVTAVMAIALLILGFHRRRVHTLSRQSRILLEASENRRVAEESASRLRTELEHVARVATAGELATSLAHEVNQPLAAIVANAQAGRHFLVSGESKRAELDEILTDIAQQGRRASEVIRRLREFLRKSPAEQRSLDVNAELRSTLPLLRREFQDHRAEVRLDLAEGLPPVRADPVQLQQVVINLLKNACEAMTASPDPRLVSLRTSTRNGAVEIEVRDTGPGLAPELAGRLFQPFTTTKEKGMGLGLTICKSIVESHGGSLVAQVREGEGMMFVITLPALEAPKEAAT